MKEKKFFRKGRQRLRKGFTLVEILITVGVSAVLCGLGAVAIVSYVKTYDVMKQDAYAEQIYVAAQNQITELQASGIWDTYVNEFEENYKGKTSTDNYYGVSMNTEPSDFEFVSGKNDDEGGTWEENKEYMLVLTHNAVSDSESKASNLPVNVEMGSANSDDTDFLENILPDASISSPTRYDGQYFIEYNLKTGKIYGVWYSDHILEDEQLDYYGDVCGTGNNTAKNNVLNDGGRPLSSSDSDISASRIFRREHQNASGTIVRVGYYSGLLASMTEEDELEDVEVKVLNGEELRLIITDPNSNNLSDPDTRITYEITGRESGITQTADISYELVDLNGANVYSWVSVIEGEDSSASVTVNNVEALTVGGKVQYTVTLDAITSDKSTTAELTDRHFSDMFRKLGETAGEDITVKVIVKPQKTLGSSKFKEVTMNSLYGDHVKIIKDDDGNVTESKVEVSQMRHLENLDPEISGTTLKKINAELTKGITFDGESRELTAESEGKTEEPYKELLMGIDYTERYITACGNKNRTTSLASAFEGFEKGSYIPVDNPEIVSFTGADDAETDFTDGNVLINNVQISTNGSSTDERHTNLGIFGVFEGKTIKDFGVINYTESGDTKLKCVYEGRGNIGGIAGLWKTTGTENASGVFANVKITATEANSEYRINAGGLFGKCAADAINLSKSYTAGITLGKKYVKDDPNISCPESTASNITANLGGLIGSVEGMLNSSNVFTAESTGIRSSAETAANFNGKLNIGGLFGSITSLQSLKNAYSVAPVYVLYQSDKASCDEIAGYVITVNSSEITDLSYHKDMGIKGSSNRSDAKPLGKANAKEMEKQVKRMTTYPVDPEINENYFYEDLTGINTYYGDWEFSSGNPEVTLEEDDWDPSAPPIEVTPGDTYKKDPRVQADSTCVDVYVFIEIDMPQVKSESGETGNFAEIGEGEGSDFIAGKLGGGWVEVGTLSDKTADGVTYKRTVYAYTENSSGATTSDSMKAISSGATTTDLFQTIKINSLDRVSLKGKTFSVEARALAVEKENVKDSSGKAYTKAADVWNVSKIKFGFN